MARAEKGRVAAHHLFPCCLHSARAHRPDRLLAQSALQRPLPRPSGHSSASPAGQARLGVELGFFCVLHTWGQNLHFHPHLHCVVPGGGLSPDQKRWIHGNRKFHSCPSRCSAAASGICFVTHWKMPRARGELQFFGDLQLLASTPAGFRQLSRPAAQTEMDVRGQTADHPLVVPSMSSNIYDITLTAW